MLSDHHECTGYLQGSLPVPDQSQLYGFSGYGGGDISRLLHSDTLTQTVGDLQGKHTLNFERHISNPQAPHDREHTAE